jgi:hypothetical protein
MPHERPRPERGDQPSATRPQHSPDEARRRASDGCPGPDRARSLPTSFERELAKLQLSPYVTAAVLVTVLYEARRPDLLDRGRLLASRLPTSDVVPALRALVDEHPGEPAPADQLLRACAAHDPLMVDLLAGTQPVGGGALFLGSGLTTRGEQGCGLAFDVLSMMILAGELADLLDLSRIVHLIADLHARANAFVDDRAIDALAAQAQIDLAQAGRRLDLPGYAVVRASQLASDETRHAQLMERIPASIEGGAYLRREIADIELMRERHDVRVKLGWAIAPGRSGGGWDERRFDDAHRETFGDGLTCAYGVPGRSEHPARPRVSPYVRLPREDRLPLRPGSEPLRPPQTKGVRRHLERLAARLELRLGLLPEGELHERLARIQSLLFPTTP